MLEITGVSAGYPGKKVLENLSLTIPTGKLTVIAGPNGCGKSTLLKALCGIVPAGGEIRLDGKRLDGCPPGELAKAVSYLAQSQRVPDITVGRLVLHGRFPYLGYPRQYRKEDYAAAEVAMEKMGISDLTATPMQKLSGGQRQKAWLAMVLAQNAGVVLLDEPTTYLDIRHQMQLLTQARQLCREGKTVVMVLHDLIQALQCADEIVLMGQGKVVLQGTPEAVYSSGKLEELFGVKPGRVETAHGWRYYYEGGWQ